MTAKAVIKFCRLTRMNNYKLQVILIVVSSAGFFYSGLYEVLSAFYGGMLSLVNALLITKHTRSQKLKLAANAVQSYKMLLASVVIRMSLLIGLIAVGFWWLKLSPAALIIGFVAGQLGFLIDKGSATS